jgi:hypothetical protein
MENKKLVAVLSKEIYDKIESKLLPYEQNLLYCCAKIVILFLVLLLVFHPVFFLFQSDFTSDAKVLTAMGVAALTFPLNMIIDKKNEELVQAWKTEMGINVKYMVDWHAFTIGCRNPELAKTFRPDSHPNSLVDEIKEFIKTLYTTEETTI